MIVMEDIGIEDMVEYFSDSLERVFSTMGEMAPVGNVYMGMEQQMGGLVSPTSNNRGFPSIGRVQSMPTGALDPVVLEPPPSEVVVVPVSDQETQILPSLGLLGTEFFSWFLDICNFSVSLGFLPT